MKKGLEVGIQKKNAVRYEEKTCEKRSNTLLFTFSLSQVPHLCSQTFVTFPLYVRDILVQEKQPSQPRLQNLTIIFPAQQGKAYNFGFEVR